ncbi:MAG TPA: radical SAM protein [Polyangiaceae bacterium]|nr:radical SAM protein [Polyangiaceae bacterium]
MSRSLHLPSGADIVRRIANYPRYSAFLLERKLRFWKRYRWIHSDKRLRDPVPPPLVYKLYLTQNCNLRCGMCMLWGKKGIYYLPEAKKAPRELDFAVIERIFREVGRQRPSFILSGGEPLLYTRFADLAALLKQHRCFAYFCSNGAFVDKHLAAIRDNPYLIFYLSVDGPKEINDKLRGNGVYDQVVSSIRRLKGLSPKPYLGVQLTLQEENVPYLHRTCKEMIDLGVDWIFINLQWSVTPEQGAAYETVLKEEFDVTPTSHTGFLLPYNVDKQEFIRQCGLIRAEKWPIQVSSYLKQPQDIHDYVDHPEANPYNQFCNKQWLRMDVLSDGQVTPCIQYPDLKFGSLKDNSVMDIWRGEAYERFRGRIDKKALPVCSSCYCLYLYDAGRKVL